MMYFDPHISRKRPAFTLVELLVVVGLIVILLTVSIPALRTVTQSGKVREASRVVNAYLLVAQSRAAETNRPVGVWIERDPNNPEYALTLYTAEVPPPYTGDFLGSGAVINVHPGMDMEWGTSGGGPMFDGDDDEDLRPNNATEAAWPVSDDVPLPTMTMPIAAIHYGPDGQPGKMNVDDDLDGMVDNLTEQGWVGSDDNYAVFNTSADWSPNATLRFLIANGEVREGDRIRFRFRGPLYRIEQINPSLLNPAMPPLFTALHFSHPFYAPPPQTTGGSASTIPPTPGSGSVPFQIFRQPRRTSLGSIELPKGTVIDLGDSGLGAGIGTGLTGREFTSDLNLDLTPGDVRGPVIIMFSPTGSVDLYYVERRPMAMSTELVANRPTAPIHLMIGRDDEATEADIPTNLENKESLWISIGHATGSVTSSENVGGVGVTLDEARRLARQAQIRKGS